MQACDPPFGACLERVDVSGREGKTHHPIQEALCLVERESQVVRANLRELSSRSQPSQRERRIRPTDDDQAELRREVAEQERHGFVHRR